MIRILTTFSACKDITKILDNRIRMLSLFQVIPKIGDSMRIQGECKLDRDLNASLNIRNIGFNTDGQSGIYACGDGSIEPSLKQEKECLVS